ncbi:MAG TPA: discoidin domain-containing protein, partial [Firmicutes bacterium]|nr:discoidin domain-containing protein [Bacillota bacterium]
TLQATGGLEGATWTATDGAHVVQAWVDKVNAIPEINEGNNMFSKNLPTIDEGIEIAPGVRVPKAAANLALNQQVTASGATAPAYAAHYAVDGFINTYWESVNHVFPATLTLDLGAVKTVGKVVLKLPPSWEPRVQTISLYGGTDRNDLPLIVEEQEYTFDPARENTVTIGFDRREVRYLHLVITANTTWPAGQVAELEVFPE